MFFKIRLVLVCFSFILVFAALGGCGDGDPGVDAAQEGDADLHIDASIYADGAIADGESGDSSNGCLPDPDAAEQMDAGVYSDADVYTDADIVSDGGTDSDADIHTDADVKDDADVDAGSELEDCPADMVEVGAICVDKYEASRPDATDMQQGVETGPAQSVIGVIPWHVNPMSLAALAEFETACEAAGKRICQPSEWLATCEGPSGNSYVFGDTFDPHICNCVDTFCEEYCEDNSIAPEDCDTSANCGYTYYCFKVMPTGSFSGCTNELGTFDVGGNVWEVVPSTTDPRGYEVRGGAYNCGGAAQRLQCTYNAGWTNLYAGFRCCLDR